MKFTQVGDVRHLNIECKLLWNSRLANNEFGKSMSRKIKIRTKCSTIIQPLKELLGINWEMIYSQPKKLKKNEAIDLFQILDSRISHRGKHHRKIN